MPLAGQMAAAAGFTRGAPFWPRSHLFPFNFIFLSGPNCGRPLFSLRLDRPILPRPPPYRVEDARERAGGRDGNWRAQTTMGAKHFGARIARLEDPALLTGQGRFVDDIESPGVLHAAFVRSPHAHARIRKIDTQAARGMAGVHAVLTADDMPPRIATGMIPMLVPNPAIRTPRTQIALARDEVCYVGQTVAVVVAESRYRCGRRGRGRRGRLRAAACGERRARRGEARRAGRARRSQVQRRGLRADDLWRRRRRVQERAACVRDRVRHASRRGDDARRPRGAGELRRGGRHAQRLVGDADAASVPRHAGRPVRAQSGIDPRRRPAGRRRLRHQGAVLSGGGGDPGRGDEARPAGEMAGGPARAFSLLDAGARPVLEGRHRGRRQRQDPGPPRHHAARHRRISAVGHHRAVHRLDHVPRALRGPGLPDRDHGGADQPRADHGGARRGPAAGGVRDGAADRPRRAGAEARPRRGARPQHHQAGADAVSAGADLPRRQAAGLCRAATFR